MISSLGIYLPLKARHMKLQDKVAVITGANSGIGKAIANRFAAEGAHVCINYRPNLENEKQAGALAKELTQQHKVEALPVAADVTKRDQLEAMMERIVERFGRLDVAVNNAGIEIQKPFLEVPDDEWNKVMTVNCYGSFVVAQLAARQMVAQGGGGKIVNISSVHEDIPFVGYTAYCASKGAMRMMTRNIAMELAPPQNQRQQHRARRYRHAD